jgi:hypothetical protein
MGTDPREPRSRRALLAAAAGAAAATVVSAVAPGVGVQAATRRNFGTPLSRVVDVPAGQNHVDVDVLAVAREDGYSYFPRKWACVATLESYRSGIHVAAARPHYPSENQMRIRLNKAVATSTPVAFMVHGIEYFAD